MIPDFETAYESIPGDGWLSKDEARLLWTEAAKCEGPILEVGCFKGRSTCLLAQLDRPMYCVDKFYGFSDSEPWQNIREAFLRNTIKYNNIWLYEEDIVHWQARPVGFAYLDGDHTQIGTEWQIVKALQCSKSCTIAIHDVSDSKGGQLVKKAAMRRLGKWDTLVETMAIWRLTEKV